MNDKELFESATATDEADVETVTEQIAPEPAQDTGPARDEHGRFAAKAEVQPETHTLTEAELPPQGNQPAKEDANVPSWRLREEREAREAIERRFNEERSQWQRQFAELQARLPRQEPTPPPDIFEKPGEFVDHSVSRHVDPLKSELHQTREFFSQQLAMRDHGPEKVQAAYKWIEQGMASRDPEAVATYQRAMQSMHPYDALVRAHQQREVYQQIGGDPAAYFDKTLEARLADPAFAGQLMQKIQQSARSTPQAQGGRPAINLPPSLNRVASAAPASDGVLDNSEAGIFQYAASR